MTVPSPSITELLINLQEGREGALDALMPLVYDELRRIANHFVRGERDDHTLQPTALVHEAYLRLIDQRAASYQGRIHFYSVAATIMRRIMVDHARRRHSLKRGGGRNVTLDSRVDVALQESDDVVQVDEALERLAQIDPRGARVVELRFFAGLSNEETADLLGISATTVKRDWAISRAWLHRELGNDPP